MKAPASCGPSEDIAAPGILLLMLRLRCVGVCVCVCVCVCFFGGWGGVCVSLDNENKMETAT